MIFIYFHASKTKPQNLGSESHHRGIHGPNSPAKTWTIGRPALQEIQTGDSEGRFRSHKNMGCTSTCDVLLFQLTIIYRRLQKMIWIRCIYHLLFFLIFWKMIWRYKMHFDLRKKWLWKDDHFFVPSFWPRPTSRKTSTTWESHGW